MQQRGTMIGAQQAIMFHSRNPPEWQYRLAAQHREDERLDRERKRQEMEQEKVRQQERLQAQQRAAGEQTAAAAEQIKSLDEVLTGVLPLEPVSFDRLMVTPRMPRFDPGDGAEAAGALGAPGPDWSDFAPARPGRLSRLFGGAARYRRQTAAARARFEAAQAEHRRQESRRKGALATARAKYHQEVTEERARAAAHNAAIASRQSAFAAGDAEAVEWFARCVLDASRYPDGFPRGYQVVYDRDNRNLSVEYELPPRRVVPPVRTYRYVKARDAIEPVPRPEHEIVQCYQRLICRVALRTMHELFSATPADVVATVSFSGYVSSTDRATGQPERPHLLNFSAERTVWHDLVLAEVDPLACVTHLGAQVMAVA
jgi:restriction system protein